jgi:Tol biopolymer transport system component
MPKPLKPYLVVAAGVLSLAALVLVVVVPRSEPAPRGPAPAAVHVEVEQALLAPADMPPIVFASNRPGTYRLFGIGPAGGRPAPVTDAPAMYPAWSPDGTRLVFVGEAGRAPDAGAGEHEHGGDHSEHGSTGRRMLLALVRPDATIAPLAEGAHVPSHPTARGDGTIAYQSTLLEASEAAGLKGRSSIDTIDAGTRRRRTIVTNRGAAYQPAWSPDGTRLALVLGDAGCRSDRICPQRLVLWDPDADARETLVGRGSAAAPAWSPDGSAIAFTWDRGDGPAVWILRIRDGRLTRLAGPPGAAEPTWSPDGRRVAFMRGCDILVQGVGERRATNLTRSRGVCEISPAWRPGGGA